ncbi:MAG TPA: hypothetical protein PKH77_22185 [Anaerolineae bacterium]|nr:hypothetical protein [Anaerolineae bacterium]
MPSPVEPDIPTQNVIWGNFIGTTITGEDAIYNERFGVEIVGGVSETFIGETYYLSTTAFFPLQEYGWVEEPTNNERNLISGNANFARAYGSICALDNSVGSPPFYDDGAGVFIGYDPCIRADAGNSPHESDLLLGGGVWNEVRNNYIGTDLGGVYPISNTNGVWLNYEATNNHVGGCVKFPFTPGAPPVDPPPCQPHHTLDFEQDANLISGNIRHSDGMYVGGHGVWLNGTPLPHLVQASGVITNEIGGNFIGTDAMGREGLPNSGDGVYLRGGADLPHAPTRNEVGATTEHFDFHNAFRYGNLISSNGDINNTVFEDILPGYPFGPFNNGVELIGPGVMQNRIGYGNVIGLDSQLTNPLGNGDNGVLIWQGPAENYVHNNAGLNLSKPFVAGDIQSDAGAIGANGAFATAPGRSGVKIEGARLNAVFRNCIGGDGALCADSPTGLLLGNVWHGVVITNAAAMNTVGLNPTAGVTNTAIAEGNWIHHNGADGVAVAGDSSDQNTIRFNAIWLNGNPALGNLGIDLGDDGDTANDVGDPDTGPNQFQNYPDPVIDDAHWVVYFHSCVTCTVDIYATLETESDWPVNRGEGRYWLVSKQASGVTDTVDISATLATSPLGNPPTGNVCVTLTGTDADGNTSEFSDCQDAHFNPTAVLIRALRSVGIIPALLGGGLVLGGALGWRVWRRRRVRD